MFEKIFKKSTSRNPAFQEGKLAFSNGIKIADNPYLSSNKELSLAWEAGWKEALESRKSFVDKSMKQKSQQIKKAETHGQDNIPLYLNLDKHFHRLIEIEEALGEIGSMFENTHTKLNTTGESIELQIADTVNKLRIPGFFAYHLSQEGLSLLHILSATCAIAKKDESYKNISYLDSIVSLIDEVEPILRQTLQDMEPYKNMNAKEAVEVLSIRFAQQKKE